MAHCFLLIIILNTVQNHHVGRQGFLPVTDPLCTGNRGNFSPRGRGNLLLRCRPPAFTYLPPITASCSLPAILN